MNQKAPAAATGVQDIVAMVLRRRGLFILPVLAACALSVIAVLVLPKTYEAYSVVQIGAKPIIDPLVRNIAVSPDFRQEFENLSTQVMAWPRLEQMVTQLNLVDKRKSAVEIEDFIKDIKERIAVRPRNQDVLEIVFQDHDPRTAQVVANTLTQNFIEENARVKREEARNAIDFISGQLKIYREKLGNSEQNFLTSKIDSELQQARNRKALLESRLANLQKIVPSAVTTEQSPVIAQLQQRRGQLEAELARLSVDAKEDNPRVVVLRTEIAGLKTRIDAELEKSTVKESVSTFNPAYLQTEQELREVDMGIAALLRRKGELETGSVQARRTASPEDLANMERDKQVDEDIYQMLLRQLESAYVSERLQDSEKGSRLRILEYARLPLRPVKPSAKKILLMGLFGGIGLGLGLVFAVENTAKSFHTVEQVKAALKLPALGYVSKIILDKDVQRGMYADIKQSFEQHILRHHALSKMRFVSPHIARKIINSGISPQVVIYHEPKCKIAEEYRVIRTNIIQGIPKSLKTIVITSTLRGEGKSTTSANLAVAMADTGMNVVLVDSDLRKGVTHELFALPQSPGLSDVLSDSMPIEQAIVKTSIKHLSVVPCGMRPIRPSELLSSAKMKTIIGNLQHAFDMVIVDAPPLISLPDTPVLSKYADGVIMIVQSGRTAQDDVALAHDTLLQVHAPLIGFIMTNVEYHMPRYMYDYYYES